MKANELRIGNVIKFCNHLESEKIVTVNARFFSSLAAGRPLGEMKPDEELNGYYSGIPLTPEILEQLSGKSHLPIRISARGIFFDYGDSYQLPTRLEFVHQFQNLYFALTGTELEYNPIKEKPYLEVICKEEHSVEWPDEDQEIVDDYVSGVREWEKKGETITYIFYCEPCFVPKVVEALEAYKVELSYITYMFYTQAKISVQRKY